MVEKKQVAVLISGNGSNLQALIDACAAPEYPAQICLVISNKADAYGLTRAKNSDIPSAIINHKDYASRQEFDTALHNKIADASAEIICLAGFMRLLTADFVNKWQGRMLNIHPSLLPNFKGANAIADAFNAGAKQTGCTVHHVTPEMDAGPTISQAAVQIESDDTPDSLAQKIHKQEHLIYPEALRKIAKSL